MSGYADNHPGYRIDTEEQARNWILELVMKCEAARAECDATVSSVAALRQAHAAWMVVHGSALGALMALHRMGRMGDVAYNELRDRVLRTALPTVRPLVTRG